MVRFQTPLGLFTDRKSISSQRDSRAASPLSDAFREAGFEITDLMFTHPAADPCRITGAYHLFAPNLCNSGAIMLACYCAFVDFSASVNIYSVFLTIEFTGRVVCGKGNSHFKDCFL